MNKSVSFTREEAYVFFEIIGFDVRLTGLYEDDFFIPPDKVNQLEAEYRKKNIYVDENGVRVNNDILPFAECLREVEAIISLRITSHSREYSSTKTVLFSKKGCIGLSIVNKEVSMILLQNDVELLLFVPSVFRPFKNEKKLYYGYVIIEEMGKNMKMHLGTIDYEKKMVTVNQIIENSLNNPPYKECSRELALDDYAVEIKETLLEYFL